MASILPPSSTKTRLPQLDVLRGVAIGVVLVFHAPAMLQGNSIGAALEGIVNRIGWIGVDLFFVLSGFLVSGLLFKEHQRTGAIDAKRFIWRRGLKIWPSYYCFFGLLFLFQLVLPGLLAESPRLISLREIYWAGTRLWASWVFLQNYAEVNPWEHTWSIAVEEHFYLLLPCVMWLLVAGRRRRLQHLPLITALVCVAILAARLVTSHQADEQSYGRLVYYSHLRFDGLIFGVFLGYLYHYYRDALRCLAPYRLAILLTAVVFVVPTYLWPMWTAEGVFVFTYGLTLAYLGFGGVVIVAMITDWSSCPRTVALLCRPLIMPLRVLGIYSYTIYLTHACFRRAVTSAEVQGWLQGVFRDPAHQQMATGVLFLALGIASGVALSHVVERPVLRWRETLLHGRSPAPVYTGTAPGAGMRGKRAGRRVPAPTHRLSFGMISEAAVMVAWRCGPRPEGRGQAQ